MSLLWTTQTSLLTCSQSRREDNAHRWDRRRTRVSASTKRKPASTRIPSSIDWVVGDTSSVSTVTMSQRRTDDALDSIVKGAAPTMLGTRGSVHINNPACNQNMVAPSISVAKVELQNIPITSTSPPPRPMPSPKSRGKHKRAMVNQGKRRSEVAAIHHVSFLNQLDLEEEKDLERVTRLLSKIDEQQQASIKVQRARKALMAAVEKTRSARAENENKEEKERKVTSDIFVPNNPSSPGKPSALNDNRRRLLDDEPVDLKGDKYASIRLDDDILFRLLDDESVDLKGDKYAFIDDDNDDEKSVDLEGDKYGFMDDDDDDDKNAQGDPVDNVMDMARCMLATSKILDERYAQADMANKAPVVEAQVNADAAKTALVDETPVNLDEHYAQADMVKEAPVVEAQVNADAVKTALVDETPVNLDEHYAQADMVKKAPVVEAQVNADAAKTALYLDERYTPADLANKAPVGKAQVNADAAQESLVNETPVKNDSSFRLDDCVVMTWIGDLFKEELLLLAEFTTMAGKAAAVPSQISFQVNDRKAESVLSNNSEAQSVGSEGSSELLNIIQRPKKDPPASGRDSSSLSGSSVDEMSDIFDEMMDIFE